MNGKFSNPIDTSKIMPLNTRTSANRVYGGWAGQISKTSDINYSEIINAINASIANQKDVVQLFYSIHKQICLTLNLNFLAKIITSCFKNLRRITLYILIYY